MHNDPLPDHIEQLGPYWILKQDTATSVLARRAGTICFDTTLIHLPELNAMQRGSLFIDVGAFIGDTARIALDKGLEALAFEPQPDAFDCLVHNCPGAICLPIALGDGRPMGLHGGRGGNMGARSLIAGGEDLTTYRLDDYLPEDIPATFLKLDAEGFEPVILAGSTRLLASPKLRYVLCEFNPRALGFYGGTCDDILKFLPGWKWRETFRYGTENWDCLFWRP